MIESDTQTLNDSRLTLGEFGPFGDRYTFAVYSAPTLKPFVFQYRQGNNHWESGTSVVGLAEMRGDPYFFDQLLKSNCAWAIPIFQKGYVSEDTAWTVGRLVAWSHGLRDLQFERPG